MNTRPSESLFNNIKTDKFMTQNKLIIIFSLLIIVFPAMSQPPPPPATPIDGGLSALLIAGGLYGMKKIKEQRNK